MYRSMHSGYGDLFTSALEFGQKVVSGDPAGAAQVVSQEVFPAASPSPSTAPVARRPRPASVRALSPIIAAQRATPQTEPYAPVKPPTEAVPGTSTASMTDQGADKSKTKLYAGIAVAVLAVGGLAYFLTSKKGD